MFPKNQRDQEQKKLSSSGEDDHEGCRLDNHSSPCCPVHGRNHSVFLSYRRSDGEDVTSHMYLSLKARKMNAFLDLMCLGPGDFTERLNGFASTANVLLAVLTPDYVRVKSAETEEAIGDYCRMELSNALHQGKGIIPVVKSAHKNEILNIIVPALPDNDVVKQAVMIHNVFELNNIHWDDGMDKLIEWIKALSSGLTGELYNSRCFKNTLPDYDSLSPGRIHDIQSQLHSYLDQEIPRLVEEIIPTVRSVPVRSTQKFNNPDHSIYTGVAGQALALFHAYQHFSRSGGIASFEGGSDSIARKCELACQKALNIALETPQVEEYSFYFGAAGVYSLACMVHGYSEPQLASEYAHKVVDMLPAALKEQETELLYGQAGFLYCLLIVRKHCPPALWPENLNAACKAVFDSIIRLGRDNAERTYPKTCKVQSPLAFPWRDHHFIGAAHGLAGILYVLLHLPELCLTPECKPLVQGTLEALLKAQHKKGNFGASLDSSRDISLTHWCHGAPGIIPTLCKAYAVFGDKRYLDSAQRAADWVWQYGILTKGLGVCHGTSGSALSLLTLYRNTGSRQYLYRAMVMLQTCWDEKSQKVVKATPDRQREVTGVPDHPYSLMEGKAGLLYAYVSVMRPDSSSFPGYDGAT